MPVAFPATITGAPQTGLTSPTYTTSADQAPDVNAKQVAITALGGTQSGVDVHSVARPFTLSAWRPKSSAVLGKPNPVTGLVSSVPRNNYKVITRKGVTPLAGQPSTTAVFTTDLAIPAGSDIADAANLRAALSAHIGLLQSISAGLGDTTINGIL